MTTNSHSVASPCIGQCCLDDDAVCMGCFRTLEEIKVWSLVGDDIRREIIVNAAERSLRKKCVHLR